MAIAPRPVHSSAAQPEAPVASAAALADPQRLMALAAAGDADAWRQLVLAYTPRVFGLLVRQCGDRELAEELTQETFVKLVVGVRQGRYDEQGRFEPWLFRVAMNALRDEMRRRGRQAVTMDTSPAASRDELASTWAAHEARHARGSQAPELVQASEEAQLLRAAVAQLPEKDREILYLRHTAGLSFGEIAEALGEPLGTVLARGHRALAKLRKELGPMLATEVG